MSYVDVDFYEDPILKLAKDPNLNKEKEKTSKIIHIIHNFPLTERKVSKLCLLSLTLLQSLEKIELNLKNWAFLSLDINSTDHFNNANPNEIKSFNTNVSHKVLGDCKELNKKLNKISFDIDYVTKSLKTLTPMEYISDSGTLLTSLTLRNIKLKDELSDKITVAYLKAKLITIGTDLEQMLEEDGITSSNNDNTGSTVITYKQFVVSLLKQLNNAIDSEDAAGKYECLAVISDMEQMFEVFKLERIQRQAVIYSDHSGGFDSELDTDYEYADDDFVNIDDTHLKPSKHSSREFHHSHNRRHHHGHQPHSANTSANATPRLRAPHPLKNEAISDDEVDGDFDDYESDYGSASMYSSMSVYNPPMVRSITRSQQLQPPHSGSPNQGDSPSSQISPSIMKSPRHRRDSMSSLSTTNILQKSTISEELPYLMTAFDLARNFEEDVHHYKEEDDRENSNSKSSKNKNPPKNPPPPPNTSTTTPNAPKKNIGPKFHYPESSIYSESNIIQPLPSASSYLYSNNSLLSKLGIRAQIINTELPKELSNNTSSNIKNGPIPDRRSTVMGSIGPTAAKKFITSYDNDDDNKNINKEDKENRRIITPLTRANLESHTISGLAAEDNFSDDYVE